MAQPTNSTTSAQSGWNYVKAFFAGGLGRLSEALNVQSAPSADPVTIQDKPPAANSNKTLMWALIGLAVLIIALVVWRKKFGVAG